MTKFSKNYQKSLSLFLAELKINNPHKVFMTISNNTCYGTFVKYICNKKLTLQSGDIMLNCRELSKALEVSIGTVNRILNEMARIGILLKNIIAKNIVIFSWSETIFKNDANAIEKAKILNSSGERITLKSRLNNWINRKVIDITSVYSRMESKKAEIQNNVEQLHYIEDINIKKEKDKERIYFTSTNRAREEETTTDNSALDFDFSYGEKEKVVNQSVRDGSFSSLASDFKTQTEEIAAKIQAAFTPNYQKQVKPAQNRFKPAIKVETLQEKEKKIEEIRFQNEKTKLSRKLESGELLKLAQIELRKGKDWMKAFLFGTGQTSEPERIKKQLQQLEI